MGQSLGWAAGAAGCLLLSKCLQQNAIKEMQILMNRLRIMLVGSLHEHLTRLSHNTLGAKNMGKVISLISGDMTNLEFKIIFLCYMVAFPLLFLGTCVVLVFRCGWVGLLGPCFILFTIPFTLWVGAIGGRIQANIKRLSDERNKKTKEMVELIRLVKMHGWEEAFESRIDHLKH
jgi:ATP-binding cassette subfamily C (CFTR/MRP) protein 4